MLANGVGWEELGEVRMSDPSSLSHTALGRCLWHLLQSHVCPCLSSGPGDKHWDLSCAFATLLAAQLRTGESRCLTHEPHTMRGQILEIKPALTGLSAPWDPKPDFHIV